MVLFFVRGAGGPLARGRLKADLARFARLALKSEKK